jgi:MerR family transcriptional regulator, light-induced transcriptional regulator
MYTIKQASRLTGVSEASLRAWERRYGVVRPHRSEGGYRLYDDASLAAVSTMRRLIDAGWAPGEAGRAIRSGQSPALQASDPGLAPAGSVASSQDLAGALALTQRFIAAATVMDMVAVEECLDGGFALGSFEHVIDSWLSATLEALGDRWARGELDVAGEHAASHAVHRRLAASFQAAGSRARGPAVVVGLPPGSRHELGALAFATALRRLGHNMLYLGADVPLASWRTAVQTHQARAAVLAVATPDDRPAAAQVADLLLSADDDVHLVSGGSAAQRLTPGVRTLPATIAAAAGQLDNLLHEDASG